MFWWMITIMPQPAAWLVLLIKFTSHCDTEFSRKHLGLNSNNTFYSRLSWSTLVSWNHQLVFTTRMSPGLSTTWEVGWLNWIYLYFSKFFFLDPPPYNCHDHKMNSPPSPRFFCTPTNIQEGAAASTISDLLSVQDVNSKLGLMSMITLFLCSSIINLTCACQEGSWTWIVTGYLLFINVNQSMQLC